jgi:hypothetical protein
MSPKDYEAIKKSVRKQNPSLPADKVKEKAAKITNARRKKAGRPPAKFHR